jgi:hypothetical protein
MPFKHPSHASGSNFHTLIGADQRAVQFTHGLQWTTSTIQGVPERLKDARQGSLDVASGKDVGTLRVWRIFR